MRTSVQCLTYRLQIQISCDRDQSGHSVQKKRRGSECSGYSSPIEACASTLRPRILRTP
jgi:hypothetical protein